MDVIDRAARRKLIKELAIFAKPDTAKGLKVFIVDLVVFSLALSGVLWLPGWPLKFLASVLMGFKVAGLIAVGHEAAHNAFVPSRKLNWWIAVASFTPSLFNYRLWAFDHHSLHHASTNQAELNSYEPTSLASYQAMGPVGRFMERFYRAGTPLSFGAYYLRKQWFPHHFFPGDFLPKRHWKSATQHFAWLLCALAGWISFLALAAPRIAPIGPIEAVALGCALPFFIAHSLFSLVIYVQHTHPDIPWLLNGNNEPIASAQDQLTFHLRLPRVLAALVHNSMEHPVHHMIPGIPCYELRAAQDKLNELLGPSAFVETLSFKRLLNTFRVCKLYDYEKKQWIDFDGKPTAPAWNSPQWRANRNLPPLSQAPIDPPESSA